VTATVNQRARLFDAIAPVRRAAAHASDSSPTLARQLDSSRSMLRSRLRQTFSPELSMQIDGSSPTVRELLDALEVATSFETWDQLRRVAGRSTSATCQIVEHLLLSVLGRAQPPEQKSPATVPDRS
jgi:hypothetical protein